MKRKIFYSILISILIYSVKAQDTNIPFDSENWESQNAKVVDFLGRKSLMGIASLKNVEFVNGVIEFDVVVNGERSYPGLTFRMKNAGEYERIYIRPHLSKVFQNVVQYEGTFNGLDSWQLYYGPGKTTSATFPANEWFHIKVEVKDSQATLYISDMENPVLLISELTHGISKGTLGLWGPMDGSAYFSNFSYRIDNNLKFPEPPKPDYPLGIITDWEISQPVKLSDFDNEIYPSPEVQKKLNWQKIKSLPSGLVDISRYYGRLGQTPDLIWAKTEINSVEEKSLQLAFGYSDYISIFLNGKLLFNGNSQYLSRDGNFQGIIGYNDYIFLPLKKGKNELLIAVAEQFGGWGFMFQNVDATYQHSSLKKKWEIKNTFKYPESVVYDSKRDVIYISNITYERNSGFISKVNPNGEIEKLDWITDVLLPTGICINNDKLYIVGRFALVEYDLDKNLITNRYQFPGAIFANDVASDDEGNLYVTDGAKKTIFKLDNGKMMEWLNSETLAGANGILFSNNKLYVCTSDDGSIKTIDPKTKEITTFFSFGKTTVLDGLANDDSGNILVSDNAGRLFRIDSKGKEELLLNTKARQISIADFDYVPERKVLVIPTLNDNRLILYEIK